MSKPRRDWLGWEIAENVQLFGITTDALFVEKSAYDALAAELEQIKADNAILAGALEFYANEAPHLFRSRLPDQVSAYWEAQDQDTKIKIIKEYPAKEALAKTNRGGK